MYFAAQSPSIAGVTAKPIGSAIGAVAGLAFVWFNSGAVPATLFLRIAAAIWFIAVMWFVVIRGPRILQAPPSRSALRTYGISVTAMILAIPLGAQVITNVLNAPEAVLIWVIFVVGVHFIPFASVFRLPVFYWLAGGMIAIAAGGAAFALVAASALAAEWAAVAAGFVLLYFSTIGPRTVHKDATRHSSSSTSRSSARDLPCGTLLAALRHGPVRLGSK